MSVETINFTQGNFNTPMTRMLCLFVTLALQTFMMWNFILFQFKKMRENKSSKSRAAPTTRKSNQTFIPNKYEFYYFFIDVIQFILKLEAPLRTKSVNQMRLNQIWIAAN